MKKGIEFISIDNEDFDKLQSVQADSGFAFPANFQEFVKNYSFSSESIVVEMKVDELRGFEFPAEAILYEPSQNDENPLYVESFRDLEDIAQDLAMLQDDTLWIEKKLIVVGYSTAGEKVCIRVDDDTNGEIWRVNDDSVPEDRYKFLASDIHSFIAGLVSKK